jgi:deazaflavin-dependent oxidoreductase (nitroreductase family)
MSNDPSRPQIPPDVKAFNQKLIEEFRANEGRLGGPMAGRQLLLLTTTGARSGEHRTVVVGVRRDGERYIAIASNNGNDAEPFWYRNVLRDRNVTMEIGPDRFPARARTADAEERRRLAPLIDYLERQQALTEREIPIVIFERT